MSPPSESIVNKFPFGFGTIDFLFPIADTNLYVPPGLEIGTVQMLLDIVKRTVDAVQHHQQVRSGTGRRTCGVQNQIAHGFI